MLSEHLSRVSKTVSAAGAGADAEPQKDSCRNEGGHGVFFRIRVRRIYDVGEVKVGMVAHMTKRHCALV